MIRPDPRVIKGISLAVRQYPELLEWLQTVHTREMEKLPYTIEHTAVFQGRCQMLGELIDFIQTTPAIAAKQ